MAGVVAPGTAFFRCRMRQEQTALYYVDDAERQALMRVLNRSRIPWSDVAPGNGGWTVSRPDAMKETTA